nr:DUF4145 domain-containing protein [Paenibacillus xylanexedens]
MICPHCNVGISIQKINHVNLINIEGDNFVPTNGAQVSGAFCSECKGLIIFLTTGTFKYYQPEDYEPGEWFLQIVNEEKIIFPANKIQRTVPSEVPRHYVADFLEACSVMDLSPKASAAISRRLLQQILRDEYAITKHKLNNQIEDFIGLPGVPSYLTDSVDAIRNIGNFAAHPLKSSQSGEIMDVETGEAEWILEVLEALFDYTFVQPKRLEERRNQLNSKLRELGKLEMK